MRIKDKFDNTPLDKTSEDVVAQIRQLGDRGRKAGQRILDGAERLRDASRQDIHKAVKEARKQINDLSDYIEKTQSHMVEQAKENAKLRSVADELSARLQQAEQQVKELTTQIRNAQSSAVDKVTPSKTPTTTASKPAAKTTATRKPAAKKAPARKPAAKKVAPKATATGKPASKN